MTLRVVIIEDEVMLALLIEDMLHDLGHEVVGVAARLPQAMQLARLADMDLAIVDVNLAGRKSFAVADMLNERHIPFVFATGYGPPDVEPPYSSAFVLMKPFGPDELTEAIRKIEHHAAACAEVAPQR